MSRLLEALKQLEADDAGVADERTAPDTTAGPPGSRVPPAASGEPPDPGHAADDQPQLTTVVDQALAKGGSDRPAEGTSGRLPDAKTEPTHDQPAHLALPGERNDAAPPPGEQQRACEPPAPPGEPAPTDQPDPSPPPRQPTPSRAPKLAELASALAPDLDLKPSEAAGELEQALRQDLRDEARARPYRQLAANIASRLPPGVPAAVMLTSVEARADAAVTLAHLAAVLAEQRRGNILLVDADLDASRLTNQFEHQDAEGLSEILRHRGPWRDYIRPTAIDRVHLLPVGKQLVSRMAAVAPDFAILAHELKRRYPFLLIDPGPARGAVAKSLGRYCDMTYLLLRLGQTPAGQARKAAAALRAAGSRLVGVVVAGA